MSPLRVILDSSGPALPQRLTAFMKEKREFWTRHKIHTATFTWHLFLFFLWPAIHSIKIELIYVKLIPLIQAEIEMISIRGIMGDDHIKGTQWCHLGRKRKMENIILSFSFLIFLWQGHDPEIPLCPREDSGGLSWAEGAEHGGNEPPQQILWEDFLGQGLVTLSGRYSKPSAKADMSQRHLGF